MVIHVPPPPAVHRSEADPTRVARLERDLEEASALLQRLLSAEDRIGLVFPVMDDARAFLARRRRERH